MSNIWHLFVNDLKRLTSNVVTAIIVLGLVFLPSIFCWYNILACWDVFDNTGSLTVAVANTDEGYQSDLVPLKTDIGNQVVSALRANNQLNWVITDEEDAIDGAESGKYYAAVVIPESFSKDMMTFYSDDVQHAQLVYYTNEKKNAVAPKVTGQGADQVSYQVNEVFTQTLSEVALNIASSLSQYADESDANGTISTLANHVGTMGSQMSQTASVLTTYSSLIGSAQSLVSGSADLLGQAKDSAAQVGESADGSTQTVATLADAMSASSDALSDALRQSSDSYAGLSDSVDAAFDSADTLAGDSAAQLRNQATAVDEQITRYQSIISQLRTLEGQVDAQYQPTIESMAKQMETAVDHTEALRDGLNKAADDVEQGNSDAQADHAQVQQLISDAKQSVGGIAADYESDVKPAMDDLSSQVSSVVDSLGNSAQLLDSASGDLQGSAGSVSDQLEDAKGKLDNAANDLNASSGKLTALSQSISQALSSGDTDQLRQILETDTSTLASIWAAPVELDRQAVFPADNFGSQMAPLYTTLALWIGSLLLAVAIKVNVSNKAKDQLENVRPRQLFLGRFGVFAVLSLCQSTVMALGNMLFLGVQVSDPWLFMVCFWTAGLVFTFFIYALVVSFANLGKAIAVFFLIIQVTAGGGSFPLQVLPDFFQAVSPYLPATHVINAMRAAMMGVYNNDFWIEIGCVLLFLIPAALLGLALRKPVEKLLHWFVGKVDDSKLAA